MLYIQHYIKTVYFWSKYNDLATVRKTTKLIEGGHSGLQDYMLAYYFYVFFVLTFFQNPKSRDFLRFFAVFRTFSRTMYEVRHPTSRKRSWEL